MKKVISLLLAILMLTSLLTVFGIAVAAEDDEPSTTTTYVVYEEDFEFGADALEWTTEEVLGTLGWHVPDDKVSIAEYLIVDNGAQGKALRVSTDTMGVQNINQDSFVTIFGGDMMSLVRNGDFTISYDLTYLSGTTNLNGYTAMIYNYTEKDGLNNGEAYGMVAVRACGTGFNQIYSPISGGWGSVECLENNGEISMSNRYQKAGDYPSLYSRIAGTDGVNDAGYQEDSTTILKGKDLLINKTLRVEMEYDFKMGMSVRINGVLVSSPNVEFFDNSIDYSGLWKDFLEESTGSAVGLVTQPNVIAEIDNIKIQAAQVGDKGFVDELPELLITEVCTEPRRYYEWAEFIEIYNPTEDPVDLSKYSLVKSYYSDSAIDDIRYDSRMMFKFLTSDALDSYLGKVCKSDIKVFHYNDLNALFPFKMDFEGYDQSKNTRFEFVEMTRYSDSAGTIVDNGNGLYYKVRFLECWNTIYGDEYNYADYSYKEDTFLYPGECALIFTASKGDSTFYQNGVNGGALTKTINNHSMNFRSLYRRMGLSDDTKIIFCDAGALWDDPWGTNLGGYRFYLAKTYDNAGKKIDYLNYYTSDPRIDPYIVSYADYCPAMCLGRNSDDYNNPDHSEFGQACGVANAKMQGASGIYMYGANASRDPRYGTLYSNRNMTNDGATSHVGILSGAQEIVMRDMYKKSNGTLADLTITEIVPNTNNLAGEAKRAFTAIELTNTSTKNINLYDYALVRTKENQNCTPGSGFTYATTIKAGNPVTKTGSNGSYYYFAGDHVSNPETCVLIPGETVVIWFLTADTYSSYSSDSDFGFDYFRQYWIDYGNSQLGLKAADGSYATKVIAVDANTNKVYNEGNSDQVFEMIVQNSVIYGVANITDDLKNGNIYTKDVISVAMFGSAFCYYNLSYGSAVSPSSGITYYGNILTRTMPVNTSMRYIAGGGGNSRCAALADSVRVIRWVRITAWNYKSLEPVPESQRAYKLDTTDASMEVRLGTLDGAEALAIRDHLFVKETSDDTGDVTYRYFDALRTGIFTLQGAAIDTAGANPKLRFDSAISRDIYYSLISTYGDRVKAGTLIVKTDALGDTKTFTEADLINAGISYEKKENKFLYSTSDYVIQSVLVEVENVQTSYTAISYMEVTLDDGTVKTYWSSESTSRSVREVAVAALEDISDIKNAIYQDVAINNQGTETKYSPYTNAVQQKLNGYIGS